MSDVESKPKFTVFILFILYFFDLTSSQAASVQRLAWITEETHLYLKLKGFAKFFFETMIEILKRVFRIFLSGPISM